MARAGQLGPPVRDLGGWAALAGGDTGDVLSADPLAEMYEPHAVADLPGQPWTVAHGLGWQVWNLGGTRYAGHGGSMPGFLCALWVSVEDDVGAVVLANTTTGVAVGALTADLVGIVVDREPRIRTLPR